MLSVNTGVLEEAESALLHEKKKMQEVEEQLQIIQRQLSSQSGQTFAAHVLSLKRFVVRLNQEMESIDLLRKSLESIRQSYCDCEEKNTLSGEQNNSKTQYNPVSKDSWKLIDSVRCGAETPFLRYEIDTVNRAYYTLIQALIEKWMRF